MAPIPTWLHERSLRIVSWFPANSNPLEARDQQTSSESLSLHARDASPSPLVPADANELHARSAEIVKRASISTSTFVPGQGSAPPGSFNNQAYLGLFAILAAFMVIASLWFFFWAKNGGFKFQSNDWDDYKSTVLRRKGPDGRTLSNATKSTKLGGSTIVGTQHYKWAKQAARSVVSKDEKGRKGILGKRGWAKTHSVTYTDNFTDTLGSKTVSDMTEVRSEPDHDQHHSKRYRDRDVQDYKKERPARVGGLNRVADGSSHFDGTNTERSDLYSQTSEQPILHKPRDKEREKERAERKAREEAAKMERRWKREAEEAAAALARESAQSIPQPKKSVSPSKPAHSKQRSASRSASPKKRDFSYQPGIPDSEVLSTAYTGTTNSRRTASYYDAYRPQASESPRYSQEQQTNRTRQSSPKKKPQQQQGRGGGGYRRGGADSELD